MKKRIVYGRKGTTYFIGDKQVTKEEFEGSITVPPLEVGKAKVEHHTAGYLGYPIKLNSMAVTTHRRKTMMEHLAKKGVPTEYTLRGRPIIRDAAHRKQFMKAMNLFDRNSFYGT